MSDINGMIKGDYFDKGVDFSATDFCRPSYQLWVSKNLPKNENVEQGLEPWIGQLVHNASYNNPEIDVIKEFSCKRVFDLEYTIGGSVDRLEYLGGGLWQIADIKTQGMYPAQAAFKQPKEDWKVQLSVYRWILDDYNFSVVGSGTIHQYVLGFTKNKIGMEKYNKLEVELMSHDEVEELVKSKIGIAKGEEPVSCDCPSWGCSYCDYTESCERSKNV